MASVLQVRFLRRLAQYTVSTSYAQTAVGHCCTHSCRNRQLSTRPNARSGRHATPAATLTSLRLASSSAQALRMTSALLNAAERMVYVQYGASPAGVMTSYPGIYLRDNCTCPDCLHSSSGIRTREMIFWESDKLDAMTEIKHVKVLQDNNALRVEWADGHSSEFGGDWLLDHRLSADPAKGHNTRFQLPSREHWTASNFPCREKRFPLKSLSQPEDLLEFLLFLHRFGVVMLSDCGTEEGAVMEVSRRVALLRETVFGPTWQIRPMANANSIAYTKFEAPMHIDMPYLDTPPGILMLHCLSQAPTGGFTYCSDGFLIAETMRREDPDAFRLLCEVPVTWATHGEDKQSGQKYDIERDFPIFQQRPDGSLRAVRLNQVRSSFLRLDADRVAGFYAAVRTFARLGRGAEHRAAVRLRPGEMLLVDNHRMLHGRSELDAAGAAVRCLSGGYMDWDLVVSRIRQVHASLSP